MDTKEQIAEFYKSNIEFNMKQLMNLYNRDSNSMILMPINVPSDLMEVFSKHNDIAQIFVNEMYEYANISFDFFRENIQKFIPKKTYKIVKRKADGDLTCRRS